MDWKVRYINYPLHFKKIEREVMDTIYTVLFKGDLVLRQQLKDFENNFASFVGTKYAIGVSNCTDALHLSLRSLGIGRGDEVITVSHTFVATVEAIKNVGAEPVLIDIGDDHNMDVNLVEAAITSKTKSIIPVHLNGRICNMDKLIAIADKYNLVIVEDSAQALGGSFKGIKGGAFGKTGGFSFYPAKLLGAFGDGGAVATNDKELADKIKLLRDHGRSKNNEIEFWGFNCRLDNLQAAILDLKLKKLPGWISRRREVASLYHKGLSEIEGLLLPPPPQEDGPFFDVFQNYEIEGEKRNELRSYLAEKGVETMITWGGKAIHQFKSLALNHFSLPRTEKLFEGILMLPMHPDLSDDDVNYIIETIKEFYKIKKAK